ncbi:hypothetical protein [Tenacibaculum maritimum]|uniref:hypothetical protein n=1 Tax=Tenacibaculum maritimum TaxID=107401 RepID=UPI0012E4651E|nr:hypothetical protein [Tenacibaculum maritimum]CAA0156137.1 conserved hypothetical protein [Tenacibaculum maritimum]CAA0238212.1 conserved hypothetical protein [Tenacibaculum maritimum]
MRDSFVASNFKLDLSKVKLSFVEQSPRFKDSFFTKYSFPFEFHLNRDLKVLVGNYDSFNTKDLKNKFDGYFVFEGKVQEAVLEILEVTDGVVSAQIDSGFDNLPNFNKKLSELPLETKSVANIYDHAEIICTKKYPEVNYNFPCVKYDKHSDSEVGWEVFNEFLNDRDNNRFITNNELDQDGDGEGHKNRNIIHPMPYLLHVLKTGFSDAGFILDGEILTDEDFLQKVIYNGKEIFFKENNEPDVITLKDDTITEYYFYHAIHKKEYTLSSRGKWIVQGSFNYRVGNLRKLDNAFKIYIDNVLILNVSANNGTGLISVFEEFETSKENSIVRIEYTTLELEDGYGKLSFSLKEFVTDEGADSFLIHNLNNFNLANYVPDMSFGNLVTIIKNWKNYDLEIFGNRAVMNKLRFKGFSSMKDFSVFASEEPTRTFSKKRGYAIVFPTMADEADNLPSIVIDQDGVRLNGVQKEETSEVKINGYCLPVEEFKGKKVAVSKVDSNNILALITYEGLSQGDNSPLSDSNLSPQGILPFMTEWYKMRINTNEIKWSFIILKNKFRNIQIRDVLYAYQQKLWIKEITKNVLNERYYQVEITTEVVS